jgi:hypothetical protein
VAEERGIGDNGGPPLVDRTFKKRWAFALFARPDKPAGAVAMGFKIYMEMDSLGRGATISDAEFMVACGVSDGSCRVFKRWLLGNGFIQIMKRGYRGHRSEFMATIPGEQIPAALAAIGIEIPAANAGSNGEEYRQPMPAETNHLPATTAAIPEVAASPAAIPPPARARIEPPSGVNIPLDNNKLASPESEVSPVLAGLNGAAEPMLQDVINWMIGGDEARAREWLAKMIHINGQEITKQSYLKLSTDMLSGSLVARPLEVWGKIATRMRQEPKGSAAPEATPKESTRESIRKYAEEAEARVRSRVRGRQA